MQAARQQIYSRRSILHHELQLPEGYGKRTDLHGGKGGRERERRGKCVYSSGNVMCSWRGGDAKIKSCNMITCENLALPAVQVFSVVALFVLCS